MNSASSSLPTTAYDRPHLLSHMHGDHEPCSADFQSAVSRISNPPAVRLPQGLPTGSRRYSRLETCATRSRFMVSLHVRLATPGDHEPITATFCRICNKRLYT